MAGDGDADAIFEEGLLVQPPGIDPETGERWVAKRDCAGGALQRWEASKASLREFEVAPQANTKAEERDYLGEAMVPVRAFAPEYLLAKKEEEQPGGTPALVGVRSTSAAVHEYSAVCAPRCDGARAPTSNMQPFVLDETWLLRHGISSGRGMYVRIRDTWGHMYADAHPFWRGRLEGARAAVLAVHKSQRAARVRMLNPRVPAETFLVVPVQHLWPVEPDEPGQKVMLLHERGRLGRAWQRTPGGAGTGADAWVVTKDGDDRPAEVAAESLVRMLRFDAEDDLVFTG